MATKTEEKMRSSLKKKINEELTADDVFGLLPEEPPKVKHVNFSPQQQQAYVAIEKWLHDPSKAQVFRLFGYAGTGKTTLANYITQQLGIDAIFAAFTGKAAQVMRSKGCLGATTIHSLIYRVKPKSRAYLQSLEEEVEELKVKLKETEIADIKKRIQNKIDELQVTISKETKAAGKLSFQLNESSSIRDYSLIVIDEASMIDETIASDLLSFEIPVLVLGDPAQLPPVFGTGYFTKGKPDFMLTEVHRQAKESPIIGMATAVRQEKFLKEGKYGVCEVLPKGYKLRPEEVLAFDQILVGKNATRRAVNARVREFKGYTEWHPIPGDRLICLKNNHDLGLLNGSQWTVVDLGEVHDDVIFITLQDEEKMNLTLPIHSRIFKNEEIPWWDTKTAEQFDFGYAVTVHKSQGSQWDNVLLYDEGSCFKQDRFKWMYTGVTRAAQRLVILR